MIITTLMENTTCRKDLAVEHGLSIYLSANGKNLLFDTGSSGRFVDNAKKLGIDMRDVDMAILSHGHDDHGGGLFRFLATNDKAPILIHPQAFGRHWSKKSDGHFEEIGIDNSLQGNPRVIETRPGHRIDSHTMLFSDIVGNRYLPASNDHLYKEGPQKVPIPDDFIHEQNLAVDEGAIHLLLVGCAHRGIVNIIETYRNHFGYYPTHVVGGFHLSNPSTGEPEDKTVLKEIASYMRMTGARYHACHCTGERSVATLQTYLQDRISYLPGGSILNLET